MTPNVGVDGSAFGDERRTMRYQRGAFGSTATAVAHATSASVLAVPCVPHPD